MSSEPLPNFDLMQCQHDPGYWRKWCKKFLLITSSTFPYMDDEHKLCSLVNKMGSDADVIFFHCLGINLTTILKNLVNFEEILKQLDDYFKVTTATFIFLTRKQKVNESLEEFYTILHLLSYACSLKGEQDFWVKLVFIANLHEKYESFKKYIVKLLPIEVPEIIKALRLKLESNRGECEEKTSGNLKLSCDDDVHSFRNNPTKEPVSQLLPDYRSPRSKDTLLVHQRFFRTRNLESDQKVASEYNATGEKVLLPCPIQHQLSPKLQADELRVENIAQAPNNFFHNSDTGRREAKEQEERGRKGASNARAKEAKNTLDNAMERNPDDDLEIVEGGLNHRENLKDILSVTTTSATGDKEKAKVEGRQFSVPHSENSFARPPSWLLTLQRHTSSIPTLPVHENSIPADENCSYFPETVERAPNPWKKTKDFLRKESTLGNDINGTAIPEKGNSFQCSEHKTAGSNSWLLNLLKHDRSITPLPVHEVLVQNLVRSSRMGTGERASNLHENKNDTSVRETIEARDFNDSAIHGRMPYLHPGVKFKTSGVRQLPEFQKSSQPPTKNPTDNLPGNVSLPARGTWQPEVACKLIREPAASVHKTETHPNKGKAVIKTSSLAQLNSFLRNSRTDPAVHRKTDLEQWNNPPMAVRNSISQKYVGESDFLINRASLMENPHCADQRSNESFRGVTSNGAHYTFVVTEESSSRHSIRSGKQYSFQSPTSSYKTTGVGSRLLKYKCTSPPS